jgi:glycerol-3-phosphate cytidylyltransferase
MGEKEKVIFTAGSWDMFHVGHLNALNKAKDLGDKLIVAVTTDECINDYKKSYPVIPYDQRLKIIKNIKCVDVVIKQEKLFDIDLFLNTGADVYVVGTDWEHRYDNAELNWLRDNDKVYFQEYTKGVSTSYIKEKILKDSFNIIRALIKRELKEPEKKEDES